MTGRADKSGAHVTRALYQQRGMGQEIGFGDRPAVLVIDMQQDFCDKRAGFD